MTDRLYYRDPDLLEFTARIVGAGKDERGDFVILDRSAFYPTSGGQAFDTGMVSDVAVVDVMEADDGEVVHIMAGPAGKVGDQVTGRVDKVRRRRHRQSHTAQHILSAAFYNLFGYATVSVHLGEEYSAVEFAVESIGEDELRRAEDWANDMIADNVPVEILFVDAAEIDKLPMRRPPKRDGLLRIIKIGDSEYAACGGTHCSTTGGVGLIRIIGQEKMRGRALVKYLSGDLARDDYRLRFDATDTMARSLTCNPADLPGKLDKLSGELKEARRELSLARKELLPAMADELARGATAIGSHRVVFAKAERAEAALGGQLATMVADRAGGLALLLIEGRLVVAAAENSELDAGKIARGLAERTALKGGGNKRQAQLGGAAIGDLDPYRASLEELLGDA